MYISHIKSILKSKIIISYLLYLDVMGIMNCITFQSVPNILEIYGFFNWNDISNNVLRYYLNEVSNINRKFLSK